MKNYFYSKVDCSTAEVTTSEAFYDIVDCYKAMVLDAANVKLKEQLIEQQANMTTVSSGLSIILAEPHSDAPDYRYTLHEIVVEVPEQDPTNVNIPGYGCLFPIIRDDPEYPGVDILLAKAGRQELIARVELKAHDDDFHAVLWADVAADEPTHVIPFTGLDADVWPEIEMA